MRVERPACLHGALTPVCDKCVAAPQVSLKSERPAVGRAGAALRSPVTKEASLRCKPRYVRHKAQLLQQWMFTARPPGGVSPLTSLSPLLCRVLLRRLLTALTASTAIIITAIEDVVAVAVGSRIDDCFLLDRLEWLGEVLLATLEQFRRRDGGRYGAPAWQLWPGGSGGRCWRQSRVAGGFFRHGMPLCERIAYVCVRLYENAFSRRCGCVCARSVRACAFLNGCAHVSMHVVCVRDR